MSFTGIASTLFVLSSFALAGCSGASADDPAAAPTEDGTSDLTGTKSYSCSPTGADGIEVGTFTLKLSSSEATMVVSEGSFIGKKKSSTSRSLVFAGFDDTPTGGMFFPGFDKTLTLDAGLAKGSASGKATFETEAFSDGNVDPENGGPGRPSHIISKQAFTCTKS
jgi:hypothetical protein